MSAQTPPEPDPVVTLSLENSSGISRPRGFASLQNADYTLRTVEWNGTLTFRVHAAPAPTADLTVNVSAVSGGHFLRAADVDTTVVVTANTTGKNFTLNVENDAVDEGHDFLVVEVQSGNGYTVGGPHSYRGLYIYDNDPPDYLAAPSANQLQLRVSRSSGEEGEGYLKVKLVKNFNSHVDYRICRNTASGRADASPGADYDLVSWRNGRAETWTAGGCVIGLNTEYDKSWWLKIWDDSAVESNEHIQLYLFEDGNMLNPALRPWPAGVTSPASSSDGLRYTITDNDVTVSPQVAQQPPVVSLRADAVSVPEGGDVTFTVTAAPAPAADLVVNVFAEEESGSGLGFRGMGRRAALTVPAGESTVSWTFTTMSDDADHPDGRVDARIDPAAVKDSYTIGEVSTATVTIQDDDPAPLPSSAQNGPVLDPQLEADVRSYAAEVRHGTLHVNRWKRVLEAFGLEDYAGLEPTTLDEARVHVDIGRSRWIPVLAHMAAMDATDPQPPPARGAGVQIDAQVLATARSKAAQTHGGAKHVNRWKRVLEAFGDGDYPGIEPLTAAGAQVYANVWSAWDQVAAQLRLIESAADPTPVIAPTPVIPPVVAAATPEVNITSSAGGTEGATVSFTLNASPAPAADLDVDVSVVTSGDFGYGPAPASVTIPTSGTATVTVTTSDDSTDEPDGTATLTIGAGSGYTVGANGSDSVDVTDDDDPVAPVVVVPDPVVSITAGPGVTEGAGATFTVTAVPAPATALDVAVTITQDGDYGAATGTRTVTIPTTGSVSFTLATTDDATDEPDGSVTATVNDSSGYTVSTTHSAGTVNVADNDVPQISITAGQGVSEGGDAGFTLTAVPAPAADLPVTVTVTQTGDHGAATGTRTVTIPTTGSVSFTVATTDDTTDESDGSVTATVDDSSGYTVSNTQGTGTVNIADNDDPPTTSAATVSVADATGSEADWAVDFTVTLSEASNEEVRVRFTTWNWSGLTGRAKIWLDYQSTERTIVFAPGQTEQTVTVWLIDDHRPEPDEYFTVELTNPQGATISRGAATGTITDDD